MFKKFSYLRTEYLYGNLKNISLFKHSDLSHLQYVWAFFLFLHLYTFFLNSWPVSYTDIGLLEKISFSISTGKKEGHFRVLFQVILQRSLILGHHELYLILVFRRRPNSKSETQLFFRWMMMLYQPAVVLKWYLHGSWARSRYLSGDS